MPVNSAHYPSPGGLLGSLLPARVAAAESTGDAFRADDGLFPAEEEAVRTAGPQRRADFAAGRLCARAALASLGLTGTPILPGPAGEPQWPDGVTGSITHCAGYRACAVALTTDIIAIGIDAEPCEPLPSGLLEAIAIPPERARIAELSAAFPVLPWDRLLFSAKEAACKLWYPLTGQWPALHDMAASLAVGGRFTVHVRVAGPQPRHSPESRMNGRWVARRGLMVTAITRRSAASADPQGRAR